MNLQFIKYFVVLAETENFTQAADKVHVVQSTFSTGIKKLEQQLNCTLFYRNNRQVSLTEKGQRLLPKARQLLQLWGEMEATFSEEQAQPLRLGVTSEIDFNAITPMVKSFHQLHPGLQMQIVEREEPMLYQELREEKIDGFFVKYAPKNTEEFDYCLLRKDKLVLAVPEAHPFATRERLPLRALDGQDLVERTNCSLYGEVESALETANIRPNVVFHAKGDDMAKALVASGIGISLVPALKNPYPGVVYLPITDHQFWREILLVWRKGKLSPGLKAFLE